MDLTLFNAAVEATEYLSQTEKKTLGEIWDFLIANGIVDYSAKSREEVLYHSSSTLEVSQ